MQMYVNYYTRELMNEGDNPPYQEETESESTRKAPVYNSFMDEAYKVADVVELITSARFLFNAGQTSKAWNQKMLEDPHFKVLDYEQDASKIFSNTDLSEVHSRVQ